MEDINQQVKDIHVQKMTTRYLTQDIKKKSHREMEKKVDKDIPAYPAESYHSVTANDCKAREE